LLGAFGVGAGAFGAHGLKEFLERAGRMETYELAVHYLFYHALAMLVAGITQQWVNHKLIRLSTLAFLVGTILFSGSLFAYCLSGISAFSRVTPAGGLLLIFGWLLLAAGVARSNK
jgi:uncharacterized membrane protein YgdD (TMEM256/DUF423 family)